MSRPQWVGFRVAAKDVPPDLLTRFISSIESNIGRRRWFYLWYAEGGLHLRMRIRARDVDDEAKIAALVNLCACNLRFSSAVCSERYLRAVHGFGETMESALAELLHEATSRLALQIISSIQPRRDSNLWVVAACSVWMLAKRGIPVGDRAEYLARSLIFARRVWRIDPTIDSMGGDDPRVRAVDRSMGRVALFLTNNRLARRASRLIARLWARGALGRFVAVHGVHMFCNELGMSIQREYVILRVLAELQHDRAVSLDC